MEQLHYLILNFGVTEGRRLCCSLITNSITETENLKKKLLIISRNGVLGELILTKEVRRFRDFEEELSSI